MGAALPVHACHVGAPIEVPAVAAARAPPQVPLWSGGGDPPADLDAYEPA